MARTTATEVKEIMDNCNLDDSIVDAYILAANALVTNVLSSDTTLGAVLKQQIEKWFTAHMIACSKHRTPAEEKVGEASIKYTGQFRENLSSTPHGQMVLQLDTTGKMANIGKKSASIYAIKSFE